MTEKPGYKSWREHIRILGPAIVVTLVGFIVAYQFVDPAPPAKITLATGGSDGAYYLYGQRYRRILERNGIELDVRETADSVENLELLGAESSGVDVAFVQGGTGNMGASGDLLGLASLYFEPLWVFYRAGRP